jgi:uncharacterized protein YjbI with pentapeptide repeats
MANPEHVAKLKEGVAAWNEWRQAQGSFSRRLDLTAANFSRAILHGADLSGVQLVRADFTGANLTSANLAGAILMWANLTEADLNRAHLTTANFSGALLRRTDFSKARIGYTIFGDNDLSQATGLDTVEHFGQSTIGIDTIYRSQGKIPLAFLRGAGVPEDFIVYMRSLVGKPFEFYYSCFISYSSKNQEFADCLHADLQKKGVRCWFAPEDLKTGDRFQELIEQSIKIYDKLLLILSVHSVASPWVEREVQSAMEKERRSESTELFPVRLDDAIMDSDKAWAADIRRTRHIGDFRNWKDHDSYLKAFQRLLRDLKAEEPRPLVISKNQ